MTSLKYISTISFIVISCGLYAQVLISDSVALPDDSAILEIRSTTQGLLPPRMTEIERNSIVDPTAGLIIYCTDCRELQVFNDTAWTNLIGLPPSIPPCPNPVSYQGQNYNTMRIGSQCWMTENINAGIQMDGEETPMDNTIIEKFCYDDNPDQCDVYGGLYNWNEMMQYSTMESAQGVCPVGWHVASDDDWKALEMHLGMSQTEADMVGDRGSSEGSKLAGNAALWTSGPLVSNGDFDASGFMAFPGGFGTSSPSFSNLSNSADIWTSSRSGFTATFRSINRITPEIYREQILIDVRLSVRCVKD